MNNRLAIIGIVVEKKDSIMSVNELLHEYGDYIIGRMGLPHRSGNVNLISVAIEAPQDIVSALSGKLGRLDGISTKTVYSNVATDK